MVKVALGVGSVQLLVDLNQVPIVGEAITVHEDRVLEANDFGAGLVGKNLLITSRAEIETADETVPHFGINFQTT